MELRRSLDDDRLLFTCRHWKAHHCMVNFNAQDWFDQQSRAGYMANQPPRDAQALYLAMEKRSVIVDDCMQRLRTDGANGGSSVASSPPPQCPASVEGQVRYM